MALDRIPFTYLVGWSSENVFYIGCRYCKNCAPSDLGTKYFTSSTIVRRKWAQNPPDIVKVLLTFDSVAAAVAWEYTALLHLDATITPQLLNKSVGGRLFVSGPKTAATREKMRKPKSNEHRAKIAAARLGKQHTAESKEKISRRNKGKPAYNKGLPMSVEQKEKLSKSKQVISDETREKLSVAGKGRTPPNKGVPMSAEQKAKISATKLAKTRR